MFFSLCALNLDFSADNTRQALKPFNHVHTATPHKPRSCWMGETASRAGAAKVATESAPKLDAAPEPRRASALVPMASVTMRFEVGSAQGGVVLRLTDAVSGQVVREIRLQNAASPAGASPHRPGQIVDLRA